VRRSLALIAVAAAVAAAAAVVVSGMSSGGGAGASTSQSAGPAGALPSGHPSIGAPGAAPVADDNPSASASTSPVAEVGSKRGENSSDVQALLDQGDAYFMQEHLDLAEQAYSQALARQPGNPAAQVGLAMVWHARGASKRAEKALKAVLAAHPDDQDAHYSLAIVLFSAGRTDLAKQEWQKAADIDPTSVTGRRSQSFVDLIDGHESAAPEAGAGN